jgi:formylglycine-generating enzyme required for sulfatase activity
MRPSLTAALLGLTALATTAALLPAQASSNTLTIDLGGGLKMEFVRIPHGKFVMGSPPTEKGRKTRDDEEAEHEVEITRDFYLGKFEVTRGQFAQFVRDTTYQTSAEKDPRGGQGVNEQTGQDQYRPEFTWKNPGFAQTDEHPVTLVTWDDAVKFCEWVGRKGGKAARLPTEAEWEYACRAGTTTRFHSGEDAESRVPFANMADATAKKRYPSWPATEADDGYVFTAPVGKFKPNAWGLYDMHGNVYEWCQDWFVASYTRLPAKDPVQTERSGPNVRCIRGGAWKAPPDEGRSADRHRVAPTLAYSRLGIRVALNLD